MQYARLIRVVTVFLFAALLAGVSAAAGPAPVRARLGVFSWQEKNASDGEARARMFDILAQVGANEVYQTLDREYAREYLERAHELGIDVYVLSGHPEWGLDPDAARMAREVDRVAAMRERYGEAGPAGLMLDVEPYLTEAYAKRPGRVMDAFLSAMRVTYARALEKDVTLLVCIPYFFDTKGFTEQMEALVTQASDGVAVMNYMKRDEAGQIETELAAAERAGKRLIHIYELQKPGTHDLTERNTYFREGLDGVRDSMDRLLDAYGYEGLSFALHDYAALREILERE